MLEMTNARPHGDNFISLAKWVSSLLVVHIKKKYFLFFHLNCARINGNFGTSWSHIIAVIKVAFIMPSS